MENTKIAWADATFNAWRGCSKVSAGCDKCYAETMSGRNPGVLGVWGPKGTRVIASEAQWRMPPRWNREAAKAGERRRVFCASLADVFEGRDTMPESAWDPVMQARKRLGQLILDTPNLDWLLLTKRPQNVLDTFQDMGWRPWREAPLPANVWIGASVEDQAAADERIPHLLKIPARVRFLSCEPLLGPVDLKPWLRCGECQGKTWDRIGYDAIPCPACGGDFALGLHWVIVGGESGHGARACKVEWLRSLRRQCARAEVPYFLKQGGANYADEKNGICGKSTRWPLDVLPSGPHRRLADAKGGDLAELPDDIRVQEFPFKI